MAKGKRISEQPIIESLNGDELIPFAKNGANGAVEAGTIKEFAQDGLENTYATNERVNDLLDGFAPKSWLASTDQEVSRINNALMSGLSYKVDKEDGKGLSSNDFTDEDKAKLDRFELVLANDDEIENGLAQIAESEDYRTELKKNGYVVYHDVKFKVKDCGVTSNSIPWLTTEGQVITDNEEGELFDHTQDNLLRSIAIWFDGYLVYQPYDTAVNSEAIYIDEISIDDIDNALNSNAIKSLELTDEKANTLTLKLKKATSQGVSVYLKRETEGGDDKLQLTNIQSTSVNGNTAFIAGVMMTNTLNDDNATYSKICHILIADNAVLIYPEFVPSRAELNNKVDKEEGKGLSSNDYTDTDKAKVVTIDNKVDKVDGKQLSTEDFTTALKQKLEQLGVDVPDIDARLTALQTSLNTILDSDNATNVIDTFQEIENFLQGITNTQTLTGLLQEMKSEIVQLCADTYVSKTKDENIGGVKTFTGYMKSEKGLFLKSPLATKGYSIESDSNGILRFSTHTNYSGEYIRGQVGQDGIASFTGYKIPNGTSSQFLKADGSVDSTAYLPTIGGPVKNGNTTLPLIIDTNSEIEAGIHFKMSGASKAAVGYGYRDNVGGDGVWLWNGANSKYLRLGDDGMPYVSKDKIWFEGNDGSGSGLDADLLDGLQADTIRQRALGFDIFTGTSTGGGYDLNTLLQDGGMTTNYGSAFYWANAPAGMAYGSAICFKAYDYAGLMGMMAWDINHNSATDITRNLYWRAYSAPSATENNGWGKWHQIAFTDSDVASADKLTTKQLTNEDLDTLKDSNLTVYGGDQLLNHANRPSGTSYGFTLQVWGFGVLIYQNLLAFGNGKTYTRIWNGTTWSPWKKMLTEDDLPKSWVGTEAQYNAITTKDANTVYYIKE